MVLYWPPRAGPYMKLMPRLIRLADEYCGKFLLVLLDTDAYGRLAREEYGVTRFAHCWQTRCTDYAGLSRKICGWHGCFFQA